MFIADLLRQLGKAFYRIPRWARYGAAALALFLLGAVLL